MCFEKNYDYSNISTNEFNILYIILFKHLPIPMLLLGLKGIFYRGGSDFNVREG